MNTKIITSIFLFLCIFPKITFAEDYIPETGLRIQLQVESSLGIEILEPASNIDLPEILPGEETEGNIHLIAASNRSAPWTINASSTGLSPDSNGNAHHLPIKITTYEDGYELDGTFVTDLQLTEEPQPIYTSGEGEYPSKGIMVGCLFSVQTSPETAPGAYKGNIILTLTE